MFAPLSSHLLPSLPPSLLPAHPPRPTKSSRATPRARGPPPSRPRLSQCVHEYSRQDGPVGSLLTGTSPSLPPSLPPSPLPSRTRLCTRILSPRRASGRPGKTPFPPSLPPFLPPSLPTCSPLPPSSRSFPPSLPPSLPQVLRTLPARGLKPDVVSFNTAIHACARQGQVGREGGRKGGRSVVLG